MKYFVEKREVFSIYCNYFADLKVKEKKKLCLKEHNYLCCGKNYKKE